MTPESLRAVESMLEGDRTLTLGDLEESIMKYLEALRHTEEAPESDSLFDRDLMIACCSAGLSTAYTRKGMFVESLASADRAIGILDHTFDSRRRVDTERLVEAAMSKTLSLAGLGRSVEALLAVDYMKAVFQKSGTWNAHVEETLERLALQLIARI
jgi:L-asparaginase II